MKNQYIDLHAEDILLENMSLDELDELIEKWKISMDRLMESMKKLGFEEDNNT